MESGRVDAAEAKTAHEARRLRASVRDLQNGALTARSPFMGKPTADMLRHETALRLALGQEAPARAAGPMPSDLYARILANNDRGVVHDIQRLVVADTTDVRTSDMDTIPFQAADVGHPREDRVAARLRRLNPDVDVQSLGVPLASTREVVRALRSIGRVHEVTSGIHNDRNGEVSSDEDAGGGDDPQPALQLVVLCVRLGELALRLNDLCCELGVPLAAAFMGADGMSGESLLVVPGVSSCLQCLDKRKMWKVTPSVEVSASHCDVSPVLPSTDCVLAGLCVQNAVMQLLSFGDVCSRLEYDGFLEGLERSELVPPVLHCASQSCQSCQRRRLVGTS